MRQMFSKKQIEEMINEAISRRPETITEEVEKEDSKFVISENTFNLIKSHRGGTLRIFASGSGDTLFYGFVSLNPDISGTPYFVGTNDLNIEGAIFGCEEREILLYDIEGNSIDLSAEDSLDLEFYPL